MPSISCNVKDRAGGCAGPAPWQRPPDQRQRINFKVTRGTPIEAGRRRRVEPSRHQDGERQAIARDAGPVRPRPSRLMNDRGLVLLGVKFFQNGRGIPFPFVSPKTKFRATIYCTLTIRDADLTESLSEVAHRSAR
jgi:hypothetical protein